eukprot:748412-Rhodomonas_salina.1
MPLRVSRKEDEHYDIGLADCTRVPGYPVFPRVAGRVHVYGVRVPRDRRVHVRPLTSNPGTTRKMALSG